MQKVCYDVVTINKLLGLLNKISPNGIDQCRDIVTVYDTLKNNGEIVTFTDAAEEPVIPAPIMEEEVPEEE